jgi:tetratricopeptide (TPR) repeat protein
MKNLLVCLCFLLSSLGALGQAKKDSLEKAIKLANSDTVKIKLFIQLSDLYLKTDPKKSLETAKKTEDLCKKHENDKYHANALKQIAICQLELFLKDDALQSIEKAIAIYKQVNDEIGLVDSYNLKGNIYEKRTEFAKAIEYYNQALVLALKLDYKAGLSLAYNCLGMTYYSVDNLDKAFENLQKSLEIDVSSKNKIGIARAYNNLGLLHDQKGDYQKSLECYNKAYSLYIDLDNKRELGKLLTNIGIIYFYLKDYSKTLEKYRQSIKIKQEINDDFGIANTYNNIGVVFAQQKQYDSTLLYFNLALKIYVKLNSKRDIAVSYGNLGSVYRYMGNETEALKYLNNAIQLRIEMSDIKGAGRSYLSIGYLYTDKNDLHLALQFFENALECGEKSNDERLKMESYMRISSIYEKQNKQKKALWYFHKYHDSFDTIYNQQKQKQLLELQTKYETAEKDNEIKLLNNKNEINRLNLEKSRYLVKQQRFVILVIIVMIMLSVGFSVIYFRMYKQKQKANRFLEEKQTEIAQQNHEISCQRDSLENLNHELEIQKAKVMNQRDSIEAELKKTLLSSEILQRENIQFKFEALKNQLNPHFLFNTFSTLISLIPANPILAEQYTRNLSSVYRYILMGKDKELVKLNDEIDFINSYMFLISIRFNDDVKLLIDIEKEKLDYYLPLLSLQLLVENAIKHNIISNKKPLLITLKSVNSSVMVENNLQKKSSIENSTKIGLQNIINRYKLICNETVDIQQSSSHFSVKLPLLKENIYL